MFRFRNIKFNSIIDINMIWEQLTSYSTLVTLSVCFAVVPISPFISKDADCNWSEMQMRRQVNVGKCERASPQTDEAKRHKHLWQQIDSQTTTKHIKPSLSLDMEAYLDHIMKTSWYIDFIFTRSLSSRLTHVSTTG